MTQPPQTRAGAVVLRPTTSNISSSVRNANELQAAVNNAVEQSVGARPQGTTKSYCPKQSKWQEFCKERKFDDGTLVTEAKILLWLQQSIVPAGNSRKKARSSLDKKEGKGKGTQQQQASQEQEDGGEERAALAASTIESYVSGVIDLYKQQVSLGTNLHGNPRGKALTSYLQSLQREEAKRKRAMYEDRHAGTIQDGYSHEIFVRINNHYLSMTKLVDNATRNRLDHVFGHAILSRGETMRGAQLADLFTLPLPNEGAQSCHALVLIMNNGKCNQFGRLEYGGCMRYKDVLECPHAAMGIYLFERFHCAGEPFPSFTRREDWYDTYLLRHSNPLKPLPYRSQYDNMCKVLDALNIRSSKKTHLNRGGGARRAEDNGASEAQIRRAGRWVVEKMQGCYLTGLPRESMRAMAGFSTQPGAFYLPRNSVLPSLALQQQIFPTVNSTLADVETGKFERDLAAQGFLRLLQYLRVIILQDAVVLRRSHPHLPLFSHPIFASTDFLAFEKELSPALDTPEKPVSVAVVEALPELAHFLSSVQNNQIAQSQLIEHIDGRVVKMAKLTQQAFVNLSHQIQAVAHKQVKVIVTVQQQQASPPPESSPPLLAPLSDSPVSWTATSYAPPAAPLAIAPAPPTFSSFPQSSATSTSSTTSTAFSSSLAPLALHTGDEANTRTALQAPTSSESASVIQSAAAATTTTTAGTVGTGAGAVALNAAYSPSGVDISSDPTFALPGEASNPSTSRSSTLVPSQPVYQLSRSITTITDVWREWDEGLGVGHLSVKELDRMYGTRWRTSATERKFYSNRKRLWVAVEALATAKKLAPKAAAVELERRRKLLNKSVDWIQKHMSALDEVSLL
ncbi:hypothetical protein A4X13_0g227 [Tilletia indica]|uniref:Transcription activator GCR1-like domain-containing protein n=1 Tax=Tilletia indica TaxID=43049 RepID=A0A177TX31_9BASI|nr:hypothetical protein A4X13_0g227 [Tilletia indica]